MTCIVTFCTTSGIFMVECLICSTTEARVYIMNLVWVILIPTRGTFNTYRASASGSTPVFRCLRYWRICYFVITINVIKIAVGRSQWPCGLRRRSTATRLLRLWVRIPPGAWMSVVSVVCQVEVSATSWSLVQKRRPTDCGASLCVIQKPREWGGPVPGGGCWAK